MWLQSDELRQWYSYLDTNATPAHAAATARHVLFRGALTDAQPPTAQLESFTELLLRIFRGDEAEEEGRWEVMLAKQALAHFLQRTAQYLDLVKWAPGFEFTDDDVASWRRLRSFAWAETEGTSLLEAVACAGGPVLQQQHLELLCADREALGPAHAVAVRGVELLWGGGFCALHPPHGTTHVCHVARDALAFDLEDGDGTEGDGATGSCERAGESLPCGGQRVCGADGHNARVVTVAQWAVWDDPSMEPGDPVWQKTKQQLAEAAAWVHEVLRQQQQRQPDSGTHGEGQQEEAHGQQQCVLVSCMAGQNRSGAVLLVYALRYETWKAGDALRWLQQLMPGALHNRALAACACEVGGADATEVAAALAGEHEPKKVAPAVGVCSLLSAEVRAALHKRAEEAKLELEHQKEEEVHMADVDELGAFASASDADY